jgi:hypothetical protein
VSDDLYFTRLRWSDAKGDGLAKLHGRSVRLTERPDLGFEFVELIYTPELHSARVRLLDQRWRDLRPEQIAACDLFLKRSQGGES